MTHVAPTPRVLLRPILAWFVAGVLSVAAAGAALAQGGARATYATPEAAAEDLHAAARAKSVAAIERIFGAGTKDWILSGDPVADTNAMDRFAAAYAKRRAFERKGEALILVVGDDGFPFPFPIVRAGALWAFDVEAGKDELLGRRIGRNELRAVEVLKAIVDAERDYASAPRDGIAPQYARRIRSSPGKRDGLYWPTKEGEAESPLGPLVAAAVRDGYGAAVKGEAVVPYHGYYYRILAAQGPAAPGGAMDYVVNGRMIGGFAVVAYPAAYRVSGIATFIVSHDGVVYERDLGPNTAALAAAMRAFNPEPGWTKH